MDAPHNFPGPFSNLAILVASIFAFFYATRVLFKRRPHFPPGPDPLPFVGNVHQLPTERIELRFLEWSREFGEIMHIRIFSQPMIILQNVEVARDLMDGRSAMYSDRPRFVLLAELMGWHSALTHLRYGARFRKHRRFIHRTFNQDAVSVLHPLQEREALILLNDFIRDPGQFMKHIKRYAAASIMKITYGHTVSTFDDPFVQLAERAGTLTVESGTPAATIVDFFPFLRHIPVWAPFATFKRDALKTREAVEKMMNIPFEMVKDQMKAGTAVPSFTSDLLESCKRPGKEDISAEDEVDIKGVAGTLYAAAEDTTVCILECFMLCMTRNPDVFTKLQAEMDGVTRRERLPTFEDRSSLPYLECTLKEVFRWSSPVPLCIPHRLMEDDVYRGYHLPKGSSVVANIYAMTRDCPNPEEFRPERFMEDPNMVDPRTIIFGFGRRICPGRHYAEMGIWSAMSKIIATIDISRALDESGSPINPEPIFTTGFVRHSKPFPCKITPRENAPRLLPSIDVDSGL